MKAVTHYRNAERLVEISRGLGEAMPGLDITTLPEEEMLQFRGS